MVTVVGGFSNWCAWTGCLAETGSEAGKVFSIASSSCPYRKSNPYVLMVQPARFGLRNDVSHIGNVIGSDLDRFAGVYDGCKIVAKFYLVGGHTHRIQNKKWLSEGRDPHHQIPRDPGWTPPSLRSRLSFRYTQRVSVPHGSTLP